MSIIKQYLQRKPNKPPPIHISGIKKLIKQGCFVTGTGIPALDNLLGGGLLLGGSAVFIEDFHRTYIRYFLKLFVAQGLLNRHRISFISPLDRMESFIKDLPGIYEPGAESAPSSDPMVIAWRYENLTSTASNTVNKNAVSREFDLTKTLDLNKIESLPDYTSLELVIDPFSSLEENLQRVLDHVKSLVKNGASSMCRIVIDSLASPLWGQRPRNLQACLAGFMVRLRLLLRQAPLCAYVTVSESALEEPGTEARWLSYADCVFELTGLDGLEGTGEGVAANPLYAEYNGLLRVLKLPSVSGVCLEPLSRPLTTDWAFKVKRRQFILQHLNLPPCLSDDANRSSVVTPQLLCASQGDSKLDF